MMQQVDITTENYIFPVVGVTIHSQSSALCSVVDLSSLLTHYAFQVQGNVCSVLSLECVGLCQGGTSIGTYVISTFTAHSISVLHKVSLNFKDIFD